MDETAQNQPQAPLSQERPSNGIPKIFIVLALILVAYLVGAGVYLWQTGGQLPDFLKFGPTPTPTPTQVNLTGKEAGVQELKFEGCNIEKEGNPLVRDKRSLSDGVIVGVFFGNINNIIFSDDKESARVEVISPKAEQAHTFNLKEEEGLVYDSTQLKDLKLSDLKPGYTVDISFQCDPKDQKFKVTRVAVLGKL